MATDTAIVEVDESLSDAPADLLTIPEAARRIGVHPETLYRLCRTGAFPPALQIGSSWRVSVPRLVRYLHGEVEG